MSGTYAEPAAGALRDRPARSPLLTLGVLALTAATGLSQAADPSLLTRLERTPAELHGDSWRVATALFFQDGGVVGAVRTWPSSG